MSLQQALHRRKTPRRQNNAWTCRDRTRAAASAKYADDMSICECVGIRHNKEGKQVTPDNCNWKDGHIESINLIGKGGRPRTAVVLPGKGRDLLEARCQTAKAGSTPLLGSMTGCNVHGARAKYAAGCYAKALSEGRGNGQMYSPKGKGLQKPMIRALWITSMPN